jgi:hypothetical protein
VSPKKDSEAGDDEQIENAAAPSWEAARGDLDDLTEFVYVVRALLQAVVDDGRHIPEAARLQVKVAWEEAKVDLDDLVNHLRPRSQSEAATAKADLEELKRHGLTGMSLHMKLTAFRTRLFSFGRTMNRQWLQSALRWSGTVLGSLVGATKVGAVALEFQEAIGNFLDDADSSG